MVFQETINGFHNNFTNDEERQDHLREITFTSGISAPLVNGTPRGGARAQGGRHA